MSLSSTVDRSSPSPSSRPAAAAASPGLFALARTSVAMLAVMTLLLGVAYPAAVTLLGQLLFPSKANGSLVLRGGAVVGSRLVGQSFDDDPGYFWSRPSATTPAYNAGASAASNLGPTNPALTERARARVAALRAADPGNDAPVPVDLVTTSGSGLDPDESPAAAYYQVGRVARARGIDPSRVRDLVTSHVEPRTFGLLGEPRVNVLELNLALDALAPRATPRRPEAPAGPPPP